MRPSLHQLSLSACVLAAGLLVSACGGGDASAPPVVTGSSGFAVDGYLRGATTLCDRNGNGLADTGEATATTDASGFFNFTRACAATLVVTGGTNTDTGLPFAGQLKAPAGSTMVTPLTTLMVAGMTMDQINTALGLPAGTDITTLDPARSIGGVLQNPDLFRKTLAMQQVLQKTAETLARLAPAGTVVGMYGETAAAAATVLRSNPSLVAADGSVDPAALEALVAAAARRVQASLGAGINAASLAQVVADALKVQTDRILNATDATLTATTQSEQGSTAIASFVAANQGSLSAAPSATTAALAAQLEQEVLGNGGGGTPPPPPAGTLIVSFDEAVLPNLGAFGDASPSVDTAPAGGTGAALRLARSGAQNFGGTFFNAASPVPFAANRKTVTARVYSTRASAVVYLKVEQAGGVGGVEVAATTGAANTWQTLTWVLEGVNPANSYGVVVFSADTDVAGSGAQTYWIDEVTLAPAAVVVPPPPAAAGTSIVSFDEAVLPNLGAFGDASPSVDTAPAGGTGAALRLARSGAQNFGGTFFNAASPVPFAANRKTVTARVYATRANAVVYLKVEQAGGVGGVEVAATTGAANTWQTLTWVLEGVNPANSYGVVVFSADTNVAGSGAQTYWIDEVTLASASTVVVPPPVVATPQVFSSGFAGGGRTVEGGGAGGFSGSNQDGYACQFDPAICGNNGGFAPAVAAADSYFFHYHQTAVPAMGLYSGVFIQAPGVTALNDAGDSSGIAITNQTRLNITVGQNAQWFSSSTNNFLISMDLGRFYRLGSGNGCRLQVRAVVTPTAAEARYVVPLSAFTLVQNCGGVASTAAQAFALSPVSQINVQANGGSIVLDAGGRFSGANLSVPLNGVYTTTMLIKGGITFD